MKRTAKILAYREGFACNSSSTHSVIIPNNKKLRDITQYNTNSYNFFGWENFLLVGRELKEKYLEAQIRGDVDHQSSWIIPKEYDNSGVCERYVDELRRLVVDSDVVILGGNDNEETTIPIGGKILDFLNGDIENSSNFVAREDNNIWTLFNIIDGKKIRAIFSDIDIENVTRAGTYPSTPELVDLNITNYCNNYCGYCYRGANDRGTHADIVNIDKIIGALRNMKVFEIALGGGEPTHYPYFGGILSRQYNSGCPIINFTTRNHNYIRENLEFINRRGGSFAYSIDFHNHIVSNIDIFLNDNYSSPNIPRSINIIPEIMNEHEIMDVMNLCRYFNITLVLLGFKEPKNRRSLNYTIKPMDWLLDYIKHNNPIPRISIDSLFASRYRSELNNIFNKQYIGLVMPDEEGIYSVYIDAVDMTMSKNSYEDSKVYKIDVNNVEESIRDNFKLIQRDIVMEK